MLTIKAILEQYEGTATHDDLTAIMKAAAADDLSAVNRILAAHAGCDTLYAVSKAAALSFRPTPTNDADVEAMAASLRGLADALRGLAEVA